MNETSNMTPSHQCFECGISFMTVESWNVHLEDVHDRDNERFSEKKVVVHYFSRVLRNIENVNGQLFNKEYHFSISNIKREVIEIDLENIQDEQSSTVCNPHTAGNIVATQEKSKRRKQSKPLKTVGRRRKLPDVDFENIEDVENESSAIETEDENDSDYGTSREKAKRRKQSKPLKVCRRRKIVKNRTSRRAYHCQQCETKCGTRKALLEHMSTIHDGEGVFKCNNCEKVFLREADLNLHAHIHTDERRFKCDLCDKSFKRRPDLKIHLKIHSKTHKCSLCDKSFSTRRALKEHNLSHKGEKNYECPVCLKRFIHKVGFKVHMLYHTNQDAHKCEQCGKCFPVKRRLRQHMNIVHSKDDNHQCQVCQRKFATQSFLKTHMWRVHAEEKPFQCDVCGKSFVREFQLRIHSRGHQEKSFQCNVCGNLYKQRGHLNRHQKTAHGSVTTQTSSLPKKRKMSLPESQCRICSLVVQGTTALKQHMDEVHSDKPFQCTQCPRKFKRPQDLVTHEASHLSKNRFACTVCGDTFDSHTLLSQHMMNLHDLNGFKCSYCPKSFSTGVMLSYHVGMHTGEIPMSWE